MGGGREGFAPHRSGAPPHPNWIAGTLVFWYCSFRFGRDKMCMNTVVEIPIRTYI